MSKWAEGDLVRVLGYPFTGFRGTVRGTDGENVNVDVDVFGRTALALLRPDNLERAGPADEGGGSGVREPRTPRGPAGGDAVARVESD